MSTRRHNAIVLETSNFQESVMRKMQLGLHTYTLHLWGFGQTWFSADHEKVFGLLTLMDKAREHEHQGFLQPSRRASREAGDGMIRRAIPYDYLIAGLVLATWYAVLAT